MRIACHARCGFRVINLGEGCLLTRQVREPLDPPVQHTQGVSGDDRSRLEEIGSILL